MDKILYIILFIIIIILLLIFIISINRKRKQEQQFKDEYIASKKAEYDEQLVFHKKKLDEISEARHREEEGYIRRHKELVDLLAVQKHTTEEAITALREKQEAVTKEQETFKNSAQQKIEFELEKFYNSTQEEYERSLRATEKLLREDAKTDFDRIFNPYWTELTDLKAEVEDYRAKRDAINQQILRQRALDEQQDFYRVNLDDQAIEDIQLLRSIRATLHKRENLDKLIYDVYISKPVQEMEKRVLQGKAPSGIYKITRLRTGEIYIGKSTDVKSRWQQHAKTAFGCGTIAHSILHTTMEKDGIQNFTFELLEEVPKDKLSERERYWINFYDSKNYGLNEREG